MKGTVGISPEYVANWTIEEAIREIVQNYLDSREEFDCKGHIKYDDEKGQAVIKDYGPGLELRHLVMGVSEKSEKSIGQFGEGLKLALLVFAREGRNIEIWSKGKRITPEISYNEEFETDMVSLNVEELPPHWAANHKGTSVKFECSEEELEAGKSYFLDFFRRGSDDFEWLDEDFVSLPGGSVWVNGSKVGEIENARFSYHLDDEQASKAVNRDRGLIDRDELKTIVGRKMARTRSLKLIREYVRMIDEEEDCWENELSFSYSLREENKGLWKRGVTEVMGDVVLSSGNTEIDTQAEYKGYETRRVKGWSNESLLEQIGVPTAKDVLENEKMKMSKIKQKELSETELKNLRKAKKLVRNHYNNLGRVKVVEEFNNGGDAKINGMYNTEKDIIYIGRGQLEDLGKTVKTLLHEAVHKHTGYNDCTAEFQDALCEIAAEMMIG